MNAFASAGLLLLALPLLASRGAPTSQKWSCGFDGEDATLAPWTLAETRPTTHLATWEIVADPGAPSAPNVLALTHTENEDATFNLAIADGTNFQDLTLSVAVQANSGEIDRGGGPIWRCRDANNYYVCRFNPLESNFRLYFVKDGRRRQLDSARVETLPGHWYEVGVRMTGAHIVCSLDGKDLLDATDRTFEGAGKIGLWTKSDAATRFDTLRVEAPRGSQPKLPELERTTELPGITGPLTACAFDPDSKRLYIVAEEMGSIAILDTASGLRVGTLGEIERPRSLLLLPGGKRLFVSTAGGSVLAFDPFTLQQTDAFELGASGGRMRWDTAANEILVAMGKPALVQLRIQPLALAREIDLSASPDDFVLAGTTGRAFVHLPSEQRVVDVDLGKGHQGTFSFPTPPEYGTAFMLFEKQRGRLLLASPRSHTLTLIGTGATPSRETVLCSVFGRALLLDSAGRTLLVLGMDGRAEVIGLDPEGEASPHGVLTIGAGVQTAAWSEDRRRLFVPVPSTEDHPALLDVFRLR